MYISSIKRNLRKIIRNNLKRIKLIRQLHPFESLPSAQSQIIALKFRLFHLERKLRFHRFGKYLAPIISGMYDVVSGISVLLSGNAPWGRKPYLLPGFILTSLLKTRRRMAITFFALVVTTAGMFYLFQPESVSASWFNGSWAHRKPVTINHTKVTADQTNFPVLVSIQADRELAQSAQDDGDDIMFTSADGTTKLSHEIESFDGNTGKLVAWVKVPAVSSTVDTVLYMYYGNQSASSQQDAVNVWTNGFTGVWHMHDNTASTTVTNSTSSSPNGTLTANTNTKTTASKIDGGYTLNGTSDYVSVAHDADLNFNYNQDFSISMWVKIPSTQNDTTNTDTDILSKWNNSAGYPYAFRLLNQTNPTVADRGKIYFARYDGTNNPAADSTIALNDNTFHYVTLNKNGSDLSIYIDGAFNISTTDTTTTTTTNSDALNVGRRGNGFNYFTGGIDETRIANTSRSASWIATEYNNQSAPQSFITVGDRQQKDSPILYWRFDEGAGTTAGDASGNKNTGTVSSVTPPTFIQEAETTWSSQAGDTKTTSSFNVQAGDVLVAYGMIENDTAAYELSVAGGSLTWTQQQKFDSGTNGQSWIAVWTATVDSNKSMTVSFTNANHVSSISFGGNVLTFRGSSGVGASAVNNNGTGSGSPEINLTTTGANSAIIVANADWTQQDGTSRNWRTNANTFTEQTYAGVTGGYAVYGGYHANAGRAGGYALGLNIPDNQRYAIVAVEVKGSNSAPTWKSESECLFDGKCLQFNGTNSYVEKDKEPTMQSWWNDSYANRKKITMTNANLLFSDDFESGSFTNWSGGVTGTVTADTAQAYNSIYSAKVNPSGAVATAITTITSNATVNARGYFYATAQPSANANMMTVYNNTAGAAASEVTVTRQATTGYLCVTAGAIAASCSTTAFPLNQWNKIEVRATAGTSAGSYTLYLNDVSVRTGTSINTGATTFDRFEIGDYASSTQTFWVDDVAVMANPVGGDLTDFPALVKLSNPGADFYNKTKGKGDDIRFVDDTGTLLSHEIESWNDGSGNSYIWVKVPKYPAGSGAVSKEIYMYYNNPNAVDGQDAVNVWDSNFASVYHMAQSPSGTAPQMIDSKNHLNMTTNGSMASGQQVAGKIDGSLDFDGVNDYLTATDNALLEPTGDMTLSVWIRPEVVDSAINQIIYKNHSGTPWRSYTLSIHSDNKIDIGWLNTSQTEYWTNHPTILSANNWYYVTVIKSGNDLSVYLNASKGNSVTTSGTLFNADSSLVVGSDSDTEHFDGIIDEVRISGDDRSIDWILAEYQSQLDTTNTFGTEEVKQSNTIMDPDTNDFSVSVWFKHNNTAPSATQTLISRSNNAVNGAGYKVYMNTSGNVCFGIDDDSTSFPEDYACSTAVYLDSKWHHVEAVKNGTSSIMLYIDGQHVLTDSSTTADSSLSGTNANFYAGIDGDGTSNPWLGYLDEVKYFDYVQTADQIKATYNAKGSVKGATATIGGNDKDANLSQGLVGYWKMDDGVGNLCSAGVDYACDSSGNGFHGKWTNGVASTSGKFGNATNYDGADNYTSVSSFTPPSTMTISSWIYPNSLGESSLGRIIEHGNFILRVSNSSGIAFEWNGATGGAWVTDDNSLSLNQWSQIIVIYDATSITNDPRIYINGKEANVTQTVTPISLNAPASGTIYFGNNNSSTTRTFDGQLDDIRIYNRALSANETAQLYDWAPGPVLHLPFDERSGTTASDKSGNGNTATLSTGTQTPKWSAGKIGSALDFDGADDFASVADASTMDMGSSYTLSAWVYPKAFPGAGGYDTLMLKSQSNFNYGMELHETDGINCMSNVEVWTTGISIEVNRWYYVTCVFDDLANTETIYIDGKYNNSTTNTGTPTLSNDPFYIGKYSGGGNANAKLDDIKLYNYARTPKQITQDMGANRSMVSAGGSNPSMLGHWKFDEGYGDTAYDSGKTKLNGNLAGSGTTCPTASSSCPTWTNDGKFGKALVFDGTDDYIETAGSNSLNNLAGSVTLSSWIKPSSINNGQKGIISKRTANDPTPFALYLDDSRLIFEYYGVDSAWHSYTSVSSIISTDWQHVSVVYNASTNSVSFYVNGVQKGPSQTTTSTPASNSQGIRIGNDAGWGYYAGLIDDVKLYNYPLTYQEILMNYKQSSGVVMGALSTNPDGKTASNSAMRAYCPPGNNETNCDGTAGKNPAPVGHWTFDERTGTTVNDISGNGNTATLGTSPGNPKWSAGKVGGGLDFDGTNDYTTISDSTSLDLSTSSTFSLWIYPRRIPGSGAYESFIEKSGAYFFELTDIDDFDCGYGYSEARTYGAGLVTNKWQHLTCVIDGATDTVKMYVNGVLINTATGYTTTSTNNTSPLLFGKILGDAQYTNMIMDDVKIYNYPRSDAQVAWDYNRGRPVGWWKFDECTGTTAYDASGFGNNGTISIGGTGQTAVGDCNTNANTAWYNGRSGKFGSSLNFDGNTDSVTIADNKALQPGNESWSVSVWAKPPDSNQNMALVTKNQNGGVFEMWGLYICGNEVCDYSGQKLSFLYQEASMNNARAGLSTADVADGNWHMYTAVADKSADTIRLYKDGVLLSTTVFKWNLWPTINNTDALVIGDDNGSNYDATGQIDNVRIYNYPLNQTMIRTLYNEDSAVRFGPKVGP